jgi:hypothetical protein
MFEFFMKYPLKMSGKSLVQLQRYLLSDIIVCHHRSVSLSNENICLEISEADKIAVRENSAGLYGAGTFRISTSLLRRAFLAF